MESLKNIKVAKAFLMSLGFTNISVQAAKTSKGIISSTLEIIGDLNNDKGLLLAFEKFSDCGKAKCITLVND